MRKQIWLLLLAVALIAAACGGGSDSHDRSRWHRDHRRGTETTAAGTETTAAPSGDKPTINLVVNAWTASALNVEIAKQLIETELGYPVEVVSIDENAAMFTGLSDGTVDAVLELWPSGITAAEQAFLDDGTVVNIGELGTVGKIGWFVPSYVIDEHPDLATWEGFKDPANAALFATAETGDKGRFLGTDPSYSQYDEAIIANLDLPFQVVFSGFRAGHRGRTGCPGSGAGADRHVLVDPDRGGRQVRPGQCGAPRILARSAMPIRPRSPVTIPRMCCSRSLPPSWRRRHRTCWPSSRTSPSPPRISSRCCRRWRSTARMPPAVAAKWIADHEDVWSSLARLARPSLGSRQHV